MKNFIYGDLEALYERTEFVPAIGQAPEITFYNKAGQKLDKMSLRVQTDGREWEDSETGTDERGTPRNKTA